MSPQFVSPATFSSTTQGSVPSTIAKRSTLPTPRSSRAGLQRHLVVDDRERPSVRQCEGSATARGVVERHCEMLLPLVGGLAAAGDASAAVQVRLAPVVAARRDAQKVLVAVHERSHIRGQGAGDLGKLNNAVYSRVVVEVDETCGVHSWHTIHNQRKAEQIDARTACLEGDHGLLPVRARGRVRSRSMATAGAVHLRARSTVRRRIRDGGTLRPPSPCATTLARRRCSATSRTTTGSAGRTRPAARGSKGARSAPSPAPCVHKGVCWLLPSNG